tara:strand:- start:1133 stop:1339 length:207 start_codon:yes stop_codon:yes gene_type:complete
MDPTSLKSEFEKQVADADSKIAAAEKQLQQLRDYKTKLIGGLETLELLNPSGSTPPVPPEPPMNTENK